MKANQPITTAVQRGAFVYVYGRNGSILFTVAAGDGLLGYTADTVTVRRHRLAYTYNLQNSVIHVAPCG